MPIHSSRRSFISRISAGVASTILPEFILNFPYKKSLLLELEDQTLQVKKGVPGFHLAAHSWQPLNLSSNAILDVIEGICRFSVQHQDEAGAIIDPFLDREHQYATPYFANAMGTLLQSGRGSDIADHGVRAMEHATKSIEAGRFAIPDRHGEFFIAPLASALSMYTGIASEDQLKSWRTRLSVDVSHIIEDIQRKTNNWRTYAMKGEWVRYNAGLIPRDVAVAFIEDGWLDRTQRERIMSDTWNLYQDWNGHPQSHAVEAVGRGNLLALLEAGYDGPSSAAMRELVNRGTATTLLLQDPTGQCPPNGRTDNHVFNDVLYQLIFEVMAERAFTSGDLEMAGQYRHAAELAFQSTFRWLRKDDEWAGSFYVTKNFFDPEDRIGYQPASQYTNYNGAVAYHLAETFHTRKSVIEEKPAPCEVGGFVRAMDERFGSLVANAGGMQMFANLRGDAVAKYETYWTPLGVVRFSRPGWDSRLGPSDGARDYLFEEAVSFAPTWKNGRDWVQLAMMAEHYQGTLRVDFEHPLIVKFTILYAPVTGVGGPSFYHDFIVTPDGVLSTLSSPHSFSFGLTLPLLEDDGRELEISVGERSASTKYPDTVGNGDQQHFLVINQEKVTIEEGESVLSSYGWLRPVRVTTEADQVSVFVYPQTKKDVSADEVQQSFKLTEKGFSSALGRLEDTIYVGQLAAGGYGHELNLSGNGEADIVFDKPCNFIVKHAEGKITAIETDANVEAMVGDTSLKLKAYAPLEM